jgi:hypothetical protein
LEKVGDSEEIPWVMMDWLSADEYTGEIGYLRDAIIAEPGSHYERRIYERRIKGEIPVIKDRNDLERACLLAFKKTLEAQEALDENGGYGFKEMPTKSIMIKRDLTGVVFYDFGLLSRRRYSDEMYTVRDISRMFFSEGIDRSPGGGDEPKQIEAIAALPVSQETKDILLAIERGELTDFGEAISRLDEHPLFRDVESAR